MSNFDFFDCKNKKWVFNKVNKTRNCWSQKYIHFIWTTPKSKSWIRSVNMKLGCSIEFLSCIAKSLKFLIQSSSHLFETLLLLIFIDLHSSSPISLVYIDCLSPSFDIELDFFRHLFPDFDFIVKMKMNENNYLSITGLIEGMLDILQCNIYFLVSQISISKPILLSF